MTDDRYQNGTYLEQNPGWHAEDASWKAVKIAALLAKHGLSPASVGEVGCGCGEILVQLQQRLDPACIYTGYDISPQAIELCTPRANATLRFVHGDMTAMPDARAELLLVIDIIEHLEDYYTFLRALRGRSAYTIFHIPLELSAQVALRGTPLLRVREQYGHLHHFNRELALQVLRDTGYDIVDAVYTSWSTAQSAAWKTRIARLPRKLIATVNPHLAAHLLGGYSLLVLAR